MFGELPEYLRKRHKNDVPAIGALDDLRLPGVAIHATPEIIEPKGREAVLDNSAVLDDITNKALTRLSEVLDEDWTGDPKADAIMIDADGPPPTRPRRERD